MFMMVTLKWELCMVKGLWKSVMVNSMKELGFKVRNMVMVRKPMQINTFMKEPGSITSMKEKVFNNG